MNLGKQEKEYGSIFDLRGKWYHQSMMKIPDARDEEFKLLLKGISLKPVEAVLDFPSGGGYLKHYLPKSIKTYELETSKAFARISRCKISDWSSIPFSNEKFNAIFCCASLHHVSKANRKNFLSEAYRILKPGGILCIADIDKNEPVALFLNGFVNRYNSMGHDGDFLYSKSASEFAGKKFKVIRNELCRYHWYLHKNILASLSFIKLMFGIDKVDYKSLETYLEKNLNLIRNENKRWIINWSLRYIFLQKP